MCGQFYFHLPIGDDFENRNGTEPEHPKIASRTRLKILIKYCRGKSSVLFLAKIDDTAR